MHIAVRLQGICSASSMFLSLKTSPTTQDCVLYAKRCHVRAGARSFPRRNREVRALEFSGDLAEEQLSAAPQFDHRISSGSRRR